MSKKDYKPIRSHAETRELQLQARQLYLEGWNFTTISKKLGWKDCSSARYAIESAMKADAPISKKLTTELALIRLENIIQAYYPDAIKGNANAANLVLKALDRQAKMLGIDEPVKFSEVDENGNTVKKLDAKTLAMIQLNVYGSSDAHR